MKAKNKWRLVYSVITLGHIFYPLVFIALPLRFLGKWGGPLWLTLDDNRFDKSRESGLAEDYEIFLDNYKFRPLGVFIWHVSRNAMWNLKELFKVPNQRMTIGNQDIKVTKWIKDDLYTGEMNAVRQDGPYAVGAGLKYIGKPGQNPWQVNSGDTFSRVHSTLGEGEIEYEIGSWKGWRKTSCLYVRPWYLFGFKRWRTIYYGMNSSRYVFKWKHQKNKPWGIW